MLRFPNPSSAIDHFVNVYQVAHKELSGHLVDIDDIVAVVVEANLATSSGHTGDRALARSTRKDRSRDPLFNQIKMYAELFRSLGWLHPTPQAALRYTFTTLGAQVAISGQHYRKIVGESALGITYPSTVLAGQHGDHNLRPFSVLLRTMLACDGFLSRDEMIVGPLSATSDRSTTEFDDLSARILSMRTERGLLDDGLSATAEARNVQINTLKNYTRWPIALMRHLGWTVKQSKVVNGKSTVVDSLTPPGQELAQHVAASIDIRADSVAMLNHKQVRALSLFAHYRILERSDFDVRSVRRFLDREDPELAQTLDALEVPVDADVLFSPFQSLPLSDVEAIFGRQGTDGWSPGRKRSNIPHRSVRKETATILRFLPGRDTAPIGVVMSDKLVADLRKHYRRLRTVHRAAQHFVDRRRRDSKDVFYPLIRDLFQTLGLRCQTSRFGANYQRWDACLWVDDLAIPIEIKSPTEEEFISTKALRQALENKIVLLARQTHETDVDTTTLIVGYRLPRDRSDLSSLISDVYETYGIRVGVVDLYTLVVAAMRKLCDNWGVDIEAIKTLQGFLHVETDTAPAHTSD